MDDFFALSKEDAPDNIPMMFITMPSSKDPEAQIRHPGTNITFPTIIVPAGLDAKRSQN